MYAMYEYLNSLKSMYLFTYIYIFIYSIGNKSCFLKKNESKLSLCLKREMFTGTW